MRNNKQGAWPIMAPVQGRIWLAMAQSTLSCLLGLLALASLAYLLYQLANQQSLWSAALAALGCTLAALVLRHRAFTTSHLAAFALETRLRTELTAHLARLPLGVVQARGAGALTKVIQEDVKNLHGFVADSTPLLGRAVAAPIFTLVILLWLDWRFALAALAMLLLAMVGISLSMRGSTEMQKKYEQGNERINNAVVEYIQAMPVVRTFDLGSRSFGRFTRALDDFRDLTIAWLDMCATSAKLGLVLLAPLPTLVVLTALGLWLWPSGSVSLPVWSGALILGTGLVESVMPLMWMTSFVRKANLSADRIHELLALSPMAQPQQGQIPQQHDVQFDSVCFQYADKTVLSNVSFRAPQGSVTALVGPSGAGKSTLARLLPRFWDLTKGQIRIGGVDIRDISNAELMRLVGFVFQDNFLFHESIAANIAKARPDASQTDIEQAAKAARIHDFILTLPQGYQTLVGDKGARLSGGQRQRIAIARAMLQNCPILVLDEATAYADPENEAALIEGLSALAKGKTLLVIAHRLASIMDADQILVLDQGRIVESGRHAGLIHQQGLYHRLWQHSHKAESWVIHAQKSEQQARAGQQGVAG